MRIILPQKYEQKWTSDTPTSLSATLWHFVAQASQATMTRTAGRGSLDQASVAAAAVAAAGRVLETEWLAGKCLHVVTGAQPYY